MSANLATDRTPWYRMPCSEQRGLSGAAQLEVPSTSRDVKLPVFFLCLALAPINGILSTTLCNLNTFPTGTTGYAVPSALHSSDSSRIAWS